MVNVTINGRRETFEEGLTILDALRDLGIEVPQLCHDDRIQPTGMCRLCLVSLGEGQRPVPSCATALVEGMEVRSHTPALEASRREILRTLAWSYPREAIEASPDEPFHQALRRYGVDAEARGRTDPLKVDASHPYIRVDMSRCIECYRCVRICGELQGQFVWRVLGRGEDTAIVPDTGVPLLESTCVSCGACVDSCPTGALEDRTVLERGAPEQWTRTTCPYCGVGCELEVGKRAGRITTVRPPANAPVNKGHLCVKGRYAFDFVEAPDRVVTPLLRAGEGWRPVGWDEALDYVSDRLKALLAAHGAESVGLLASARATNEDNYVAQKFARVVLGTPNVDCCARVCHAPSAAALGEMLGAGAATGSYDDIERARSILVCGANALESHAVVGARIRQAALRGARLIVIDSRRVELAETAELFLQPIAGTNIPLLNAIANVIVGEGRVDPEFLRERVSGWTEFEAFIRPWTPERASEACGVPAESIRAAARLYSTARPSLCFHGLGVTEHEQGTEAVMCLVNLALLTGNLGVPGAGINPLRGQNNVQGAAHMGCEPKHLPGYATLEAAGDRFERLWGAPLPRGAGLDLMEMMDAARAHRLKGLWAIGYDVLLTNPAAELTRRALGELELVIVQDLFLNETARQFATVFLPVASAFEKDGTFMNSERRIQRVRPVIPAPGNVPSDWEVLCRVARRMGHPDGFEFGSAEEIWEEVRRVWPVGAGITYGRLEQGGLQWPCPDTQHPGTTTLHEERFSSGQRAALRRIAPRAPTEETSQEFPFILVTGRTLYQFNAGTMTGRTPNTVLRPNDVLDVSPTDAARLGVEDGELVRVRSRHGEATLPVHVRAAQQAGEVFASFQTTETFINRVTSPSLDGTTHTPQYKRTAIAIQKIAPALIPARP